MESGSTNRNKLVESFRYVKKDSRIHFRSIVLLFDCHSLDIMKLICFVFSRSVAQVCGEIQHCDRERVSVIKQEPGRTKQSEQQNEEVENRANTRGVNLHGFDLHGPETSPATFNRGILQSARDSGDVKVEGRKEKTALDRAFDQQNSASKDWQLSETETQQQEQCWVETSRVISRTLFEQF